MKDTLTQSLFVDIFSTPHLLEQFNLKQWEQLLRILRGADMLGSFYYFLDKNAQLSNVPDFAIAHLRSAKRYSDRQVQQISAETDILQQTLQTVDCRPIFLKGAAYVLNKSSNHLGRVMTDIDILVPKADLESVENALKLDGWIEKVLDDYDQQYYRKWAHELAPFTHPERGATLDVHHTIIPPISGITVPESFLFNENIVLEDGKETLSESMVILHCLVHLFYNEDYEKSFRDILDIHLLLLDYERNEDISQICVLARNLGFNKEFYYACSITDQLFRTQRVAAVNSCITPFIDTRLTNFFIRNIILAALIPSHDLLDKRWNKLARYIMFLRGHFLKMPLGVLVPHFWVKSRRALVMLVMGPHHYEK
ncbi:nucleotidyltransferase family protein [Paraglaciecola polaris]|uniref:Nucleotidyltransferase family protein n=2 Tax=Paraglaciecola polaris TaxID=222814 RepID=K6ZS45_9ALTE|nr:nucleotidyltransferase family protein [Paraglaciecola polaris]GAC33127.1 hypothetical protein GPLA_2222 [Paraglaciecola polaris LMG 21857]|tara:strand:- start:30084 stop:31187 length:1104 start_codon:yes stop_codon:yes gene_type:complete